MCSQAAFPTQSAGTNLAFGASVALGPDFVASNSTGVSARLDAIGSRVAAMSDVTSTAALVPPNATTLFLVGRGFDVVPIAGGSQGTLRLGGLIGRYVGPGQVLDSGPAGQASLQIDLGAVPFATGFQSIVAGELLHFQAWYRDANPGPTSNFSNVGRIVFE